MTETTFCKMEFLRDENGEEMLLKDGQYQVMMEWERPYMEACIETLQPAGDVLEIGFGCGYSASAIQKHPIKSHTIIEYHPVIFEKAKEWAKDKPNVILVQDTWQNALPKLGQFDTIFFDDYPLESGAETQKAEKARSRALSLLDKGRKLLDKVEKQFAFLSDMRYGDEDIDYFFQKLERKHRNPAQHYLRFFYDLQKKGNITPDQWEQVKERLLDEGLANHAEIEVFEESQATTPTSGRKSPDRFFKFLDILLASHTRSGSRISCFIEDPASKYEDESFVQYVIANPFLDYKETRIPIKVSDKCHYYKGEEALIITITKH